MSFSKRLPIAVAVASAIGWASSSAMAHHSRAEFSDEMSEMEGELLRVHWRNPHAGLDIQIVNAEGQEEIWRVETFWQPESVQPNGR